MLKRLALPTPAGGALAAAAALSAALLLAGGLVVGSATRAGAAEPAPTPGVDVAMQVTVPGYVAHDNDVTWIIDPVNRGTVTSSKPVVVTLIYNEGGNPPVPNQAHAYSDIRVSGITHPGPGSGSCAVNTSKFTVTCNVGRLAPGADASFSVTVRAGLGLKEDDNVGWEVDADAEADDVNTANNIESSGILTEPTLGSFEAVSAVPGGVQVAGWAAVLPHAGDPMTARVTIGSGKPYGLYVGDPRPDINRSLGIAGDHGFSGVVPATAAGTQSVCITAADDSSDRFVELGCKTVTIPSGRLPVITGAGHSLPLSSTLTAGQSIASVGGQYRLTMQSDGNLVETGDGRALWSSGTSGAGNTFHYDYAGALYVSPPSGGLLWAVINSTQDPAAQLELTPQGGLVSVDSTGELWTNGAPGTGIATRGTTLTAGQYLHAGVSRLILQSDGNLVDYDGARALWSSGTSGHAGDSLHVQSDGNVVIYSDAGRALWTTRTGGAGAGVTLSISPSGALALARGATTLWHAG
ncbi:hypothetical protein [Frondihabitans australicus]|uniref:D-mannose binding lectin n=1 Tax=Frondihabitans australicus TaxID=386892 RepID=A0A495IFK7_9MICO|nr:hypothetical protein [Frondihabitans australicus]RKR74724.1 D-mannose binding lectin [Frondihabitans australicus]